MSRSVHDVLERAARVPEPGEEPEVLYGHRPEVSQRCQVCGRRLTFSITNLLDDVNVRHMTPAELAELGE